MIGSLDFLAMRIWIANVTCQEKKNVKMINVQEMEENVLCLVNKNHKAGSRRVSATRKCNANALVQKRKNVKTLNVPMSRKEHVFWRVILLQLIVLQKVS